MKDLREARSRPVDLLTAYYLGTPLFLAIDLAGAPVRVAGLGSLRDRVLYYALVFALGWLCRVRPAVAPWVGMLESSVNLFLLMLGILLPIWSLPDAVLAGGATPAGLDAFDAANALLVGGALVVSFHRHRSAAQRAMADRRLP